jgi:dienelactone hydrolase
MPDLFQGEVINGGQYEFLDEMNRTPEGLLDRVKSGFSFAKNLAIIISFITKFPLKRVQPIMDSTLDCIINMGITKIGAIGYSFGGVMVFNLSKQKRIDCFVSVCPGGLKIPSDIQGVLKPLLLICAGKDSLLPRKDAEIIIKTFRESQMEAEMKWYEGTQNGFAIRCDDEAGNLAKSSALDECTKFFNKYKNVAFMKQTNHTTFNKI